MNRIYEEWLKYYENATKEQVIEDMMMDIKEIERLNNIIDKATEYLKDNACYNDMGNFNDDLDYDKCGDLLEILDKVSDKE